MTRNEGGGDPEVVKTLGIGARRGRRRWLWIVGGLAVLGLLGFQATRFWQQRAAARAPAYESEKVKRTDVQVVVSATGTLKGRNTVDIGTEVSGRVTAVNVDFNDPVKKGQVLAEIDPEQTRAEVDQATARLSDSDAAIVEAQATLTEANQAAARAEEQVKKGLVSQRDYETAIAQRDRALASIARAKATNTLNRAAVKVARSRLEKTKILSPIDGVVLSRTVEPGQTVAASFSTPVLFKLAQDLRQMSLYVYIDEADIGRVREGQSATFTVDAYPEHTFPSKVISLRNEPKEEQNVVTYEAVLLVDNSELLLRPGMTATATIIADERKNVLTVPNAALRFTPPTVQSDQASSRGARRVWTLKENEPKPITIKTGASDGTLSEVLSGGLKEGDEVLTDVVEKKRERP
jgi:HlyD family secretion protein